MKRELLDAMKTTILAIFLSTSVLTAAAQGTLNFANAAVGVNAPVMLSNWGQFVGWPDRAYEVDLYWGPAGTTDSHSLTGLNAPAFFNSGAQAGYFTGGARTISGVAGDTSIVVQVRGWESVYGTYEAAAANPFAGRGFSGLFNVTLASPPATPANLVGLNSFPIYVVPEPNTGALGLVGAGTLLVLRHRRKSSATHLKLKTDGVKRILLMKRILILSLLSTFAFAGFCQGTLNFANAAAGVNAPVSVVFLDGRPNVYADNRYQVDLYFGPAGTTSSSSLVPLRSPAVFNVGAQAGYFTGGARTIPGSLEELQSLSKSEAGTHGAEAHMNRS